MVTVSTVPGSTSMGGLGTGAGAAAGTAGAEVLADCAGAPAFAVLFASAEAGAVADEVAGGALVLLHPAPASRTPRTNHGVNERVLMPVPPKSHRNLAAG